MFDVALNRPDGAELLAAVRIFLEKEVAPQVTGATQFNLRIANNVLAIVERELTQRGRAEADETAGLRALLEDVPPDASLSALNQILVDKIRSGAFDASNAQRPLLKHLQDATAAKLAIDNPKYP
jgi:hypothetical protein